MRAKNIILYEKLKRLNAEVNEDLEKLQVNINRNDLNFKSEEFMNDEMYSLNKQEVVLKNELKNLKQKINVDTSYNESLKIEEKIKSNNERNRLLCKSIKEIRNMVNRNGNYLTKISKDSEEIHKYSNIEKLLKIELDKEVSLINKMKKEQLMIEEKKKLKQDLTIELKKIKSGNKELKQYCFSNFENSLMNEKLEMGDLNLQLTKLRSELMSLQEKNDLEIASLKGEIQFTRAKLHSRKFVSFFINIKINR